MQNLSLPTFQKDLVQPTLENCKVEDAHIQESRIAGPTVRNVVFDGLLMEQSFLHTGSIVDVRARNVIFGQGTTISWSYIEHVRLRPAHAMTNSIITNCMVVNGEFSNGTYRAVRFDNTSFVNTIFSACKFIASSFENCSFSGCMFYKCSFTHNDTKSTFKKCDFEPDSVYGDFSRKANDWSLLKQLKVEPTNFLHCGGSIELKSCKGMTNLITDAEDGKTKREQKFSALREPTHLGGNKAFTYAFSKWWNTPTTYSSAIPLPAASESTAPSTAQLPTENKHRAYRFKTAGV